MKLSWWNSIPSFPKLWTPNTVSYMLGNLSTWAESNGRKIKKLMVYLAI